MISSGSPPDVCLSGRAAILLCTRFVITPFLHRNLTRASDPSVPRGCSLTDARVW